MQITTDVINHNVVRLIRETREFPPEDLIGEDPKINVLCVMAYIDGILAMAEALKEVLNT